MKHPSVAKEFARHTTKQMYENLPDHVRVTDKSKKRSKKSK